MIPNAAEIARRQWTALFAVRLVVLFLFFLSMMPLVSWFTEGFSDDDFFDLGYYADHIAFTIALLLFTGIILLLQRRIARLLVPIVRYTRCPACRYRIEGLNDPICPECGLALTAEFLDPDEHQPQPDTTRISYHVVENRRHIIANIFRALGVFMFFYWALILVSGIALVVFSNDGDMFIYAISTLLQSGVVFVFMILLLFGHHRLARFCVPTPIDSSPRQDSD